MAGLIIAISLAGCGGRTSGQVEDEYSGPLYDDRVVTVRIVMASEDWEFMQKNARAEEYEKADFWFDDELVPDVAVRPKGNSSLMSIARSGSARMSLKVDFNFFNSSRTLYGLKKVNLNNGFSDPTLIREVLSYELFEQMDIPTPRASFVDLWVNDTHLGVYTMVEQIDTTFLSNNFADATGNLYKPEMPAAYLNWTEEDLSEDKQSDADNNNLDVNLSGGRLSEIMQALGQEETTEGEVAVPRAPQGPPGGMPFRDLPTGNITQRGMPFGGMPPMPPEGMPFRDLPAGNITQRGMPFGGMPPMPPEGMPFGGMPTGNITPRGMPFGGMPPGGMPFGQQGNLLEQMGLKTNENNPDHSALLGLLDVLNNEPDETFPEEIEKVLDVDQVLRYLAVSTVLVHLDNYIGMGHNYYLYEVDGKFTIIPWDLNMSFGGFSLGVDRQRVIDFYIDEPTVGTVANRPLVSRLLAVPSYLETYHGYLKEIINGPFSPEVMEAKIDELANLIRPYVEADTLKFYSTAEFEKGLGEDVAISTRMSGMGMNIGLKAFVAQRVESIKKQLEGELPSKSSDGTGYGGNRMPGGFPGMQGNG
jgi:spore coat protein CotH